LTSSCEAGEDGRMEPQARRARGTWFFVGIGAALGLVLGIVVSVTTDLPLAPEAGLLLGALAGRLLGSAVEPR